MSGEVKGRVRGCGGGGQVRDLQQHFGHVAVCPSWGNLVSATRSDLIRQVSSSSPGINN